MNTELWLEYGFVKDGFHDMCWYNEGRWQELPHFLRMYVRWMFKPNRYFLWRFGTKNHFPKGSAR